MNMFRRGRFSSSVVSLTRSIYRETYFLGKRLKHFSPFHKQDRKILLFPNTEHCTLDIPIPIGTKICHTLDSFELKFSKRDFKRCAEDIAKRGPLKWNEQNQLYVLEPRAHNIQLEMTTMAIGFLEDMSHFKKENLLRGCFDQNGDVYKHGRMALDIGCGRGICMHPLVNKGYTCIGVDLDLSNLSIFKINKNNVSWLNSGKNENPLSSTAAAADVVRWDIRHGLPFRNNMFDVVISISFLQWLFRGNVHHQLDTFYSSISKVLSCNGAAIIQFYPRNRNQLKTAVSCAAKYFKGALIADYPHINRGRKLFLLLHKL